MKERIAFLTGASGFVGRYLVDALLARGYVVRAGVRSSRSAFEGKRHPRLSIHEIDVRAPDTLDCVMKGADYLFHMAALVDASRPRKELNDVNAGGTRIVWECAARAGIAKAVYCSSAAVYGLLSRSPVPITEEVPARAIEPYGHSKLLGEIAALEVARRTGLRTVILRPVAVFGPEEHTPFGRHLRDAAVSKILIAGGFRNKSFSYVYVEDVAEAIIHLAETHCPQGEIYNVAVQDPVRFEDAFRIYVSVLGKAGRSYTGIRALGVVSLLLHRFPRVLDWCMSVIGEQTFFRIWHPGFDLTYSAAKLSRTSFHARWQDFETVLSRCVRT